METDLITYLEGCLIDLNELNNSFRVLLIEGGEEVPKAYNKGILKAIEVIKSFNDRQTP